MTNDDASNNNPQENREKSLKAISATTSQLPSLKRLKPKNKSSNTHPPSNNWNRNRR
jgi:hypothetical protein